jgi:hypothetical protein
VAKIDNRIGAGTVTQVAEEGGRWQRNNQSVFEGKQRLASRHCREDHKTDRRTEQTRDMYK